MRNARTWLAALLCACALGACAHGIGSSATSGAIAGFQTHVETAAELEQKTIIEHAAASAVRSAVHELKSLGRPMTGAEGIQPPGVGGTGAPPTPIEAMSDQAGRALARSLSEELVLQLGPNGEGPLGASLAASAERICASAARAAKAELRDVLAGAIPMSIAVSLGLLLGIALMGLRNLWRGARPVSRRTQA